MQTVNHPRLSPEIPYAIKRPTRFTPRLLTTRSQVRSLPQEPH
jgi:hypothetical protein